MIKNFYQAKPIEAVQVSWENCEEITEWCGGELRQKSLDALTMQKRITIQLPKISKKLPNGETTLSSVSAYQGDWVIREPSGRFRVFKPKTFDRIFEEVDPPQESFGEGEGLFE